MKTYNEYKQAAETAWHRAEAEDDTPLSAHLDCAAAEAETDGRPRIAAHLRRNAEWCRHGTSIHSPDAP